MNEEMKEGLILKYGKMTEKEFLELPIFKERTESPVGKVWRIEEEVKLDTLNVIMVCAEAKAEENMRFEVSMVWVENVDNAS